MKPCLNILFWGAVALHITVGIAAGCIGNWIALAWIITTTLWMIDAEFSGRRADRYYRELIDALEECAKADFDCLKLTMEICALETKNALLEKDYNKRQIRRKMHFDRLRSSVPIRKNP